MILYLHSIVVQFVPMHGSIFFIIFVNFIFFPDRILFLGINGFDICLC